MVRYAFGQLTAQEFSDRGHTVGGKLVRDEAILPR